MEPQDKTQDRLNAQRYQVLCELTQHGHLETRLGGAIYVEYQIAHWEEGQRWICLSFPSLDAAADHLLARPTAKEL